MSILRKKADPTNAKGRSRQPDCTNQNINSADIFTDLSESIKADLLAGRDIRLIDFAPEQRPAVVGIMAQLRDAYPIRTGWKTIRESHLSETRLRARRYSIPSEFLREVMP
jgi:hypothetical protein